MGRHLHSALVSDSTSETNVPKERKSLKRFHATLRDLLVAIVMIVTMSGVAIAQDAYPSKPIKIIVPYSAGGGGACLGIESSARL